MYEEFRVGAVLSKTFSILGKNFITFLVLAIILYLPVDLILIVAVSSLDFSDLKSLEDVAYTILTFTGILVLANLVVGAVLSGTLTYAVVEELRGNRPSIGACLSMGLKRLVPVILVSLLFALAIGVGLVLCIIPGIILMTMYYVAVPVAVVERPGIFASLSRSSELTDGYRGQVFGIVIVLGIINYLLTNFLPAQFLGDPESFRTAEEFTSYLQNSTYFGLAVGIFTSLLSATAAAVTYHDLRVSKDGIGVEELAAVFE